MYPNTQQHNNRIRSTSFRVKNAQYHSSLTSEVASNHSLNFFFLYFFLSSIIELRRRFFVFRMCTLRLPSKITCDIYETGRHTSSRNRSQYGSTRINALSSSRFYVACTSCRLVRMPNAFSPSEKRKREREPRFVWKARRVRFKRLWYLCIKGYKVESRLKRIVAILRVFAFA